MVKKEQILELLNAYKSEVDNFNDAIFTDKFEALAQDIVKILDIPVVSHCACTPDETTGTTSVNCCNICGKPAEDFWRCG